MSGHPAYYWRNHRRYVAWFCNPDDARRFLDAGEEVLSVWEPGFLSAIGYEPEPGQDYENEGHGFCLADECPHDEDDG